MRSNTDNNNITPLEYAKLCSRVYDDIDLLDSDGWVRLTDVSKMLSDYQLNPTIFSRLSSWYNYATSNEGYFGALYKNEDKNTFVIVHRGTDMTSLLQDWYRANGAILSDTIPDQFSLAKEFDQFVKETIVRDGSFSYAGHSLGAVLAELSAVEFRSTATTFESPGSRLLLEPDQLQYADDHITCYNAAPNPINTAKDHVGKIYRVRHSLDIAYNQSWNEIIDYTLDQHSIDNLIIAFNQDSGLLIEQSPATQYNVEDNIDGWTKLKQSISSVLYQNPFDPAALDNFLYYSDIPELWDIYIESEHLLKGDGGTLAKYSKQFKEDNDLLRTKIKPGKEEGCCIS